MVGGTPEPCAAYGAWVFETGLIAAGRDPKRLWRPATRLDRPVQIQYPNSLFVRRWLYPYGTCFRGYA